jgi:hypothetical protein
MDEILHQLRALEDSVNENFQKILEAYKTVQILMDKLKEEGYVFVSDEEEDL